MAPHAPAAEPQVAVPPRPFGEADQAALAAADKVAADWVCARGDDALALVPPGSAPLPYTDAARDMLLRAWTLAARLNSRNLVIEHLIVALATGDKVTADELDAVAGGLPGAALAGALVRVASLDVSAIPQTIETVGIEKGLVPWLREAGRVAAARADAPGLVPGDLVAALRSSYTDVATRAKVRRLLRHAAAVGHTQSELVKARRGVESTRSNVSFFRSETEKRLADLKDWVKGLDKNIAKLDGSLAVLPSVVDGGLKRSLEDLDQRMMALVATVRDRQPGGPDAPTPPDSTTAAQLAGLQSLLEQVRTSLTELKDRVAAPADPGPGARSGVDPVTFAADCRKLLTDLDRRTAEIKAALPRPPGALWLTLLVIAVAGLGAAAGLALHGALPDIVRQLPGLPGGLPNMP